MLLRRTFLLAGALAGSAHAPVAAAAGRISAPQYWPVSKSNPYSADPVIARRLRCAALVEAIGTTYFSPVGFHYDAAERRRIDEMTGETPRMPQEDVAERRAYAQASYDLYDAAESLGRTKAGYSRTDFYGWYGDSQKREAIAKVRGGTAYQAFLDPALRCFEYPQLSALRPAISARLSKPVPGTEQPASPKIQTGWLPSRSMGYMYGPITYRYLGCAGIVQAMAVARFGPMPEPGTDGPPSNARLDAAAMRARTSFQKAVREAFEAGQKHLVANTAAERQSYLLSFFYATSAAKPLVNADVAAEAMAEPSLRCGELPALSGFVQQIGSGNVGVPVIAAKPAGFVTWPDRTSRYFAHPTAFRSLFCAALVDASYNRDKPSAQWFGPPSPNKMRQTGEGQDAAAARKAVLALYDKGKIDEDARAMGNMSISDYARTYFRATAAAKNLFADRQGLAALNDASTRCFELPELAPIADDVRQHIQQ